MKNFQLDSKSRPDRSHLHYQRGSGSRTRPKEGTSRQESLKKNNSIGGGPKVVSVNLEEDSNNSSVNREGEASESIEEVPRKLQRSQSNSLADFNFSAIDIATLLNQKKRREERRNTNNFVMSKTIAVEPAKPIESKKKSINNLFAPDQASRSDRRLVDENTGKSR